MFVLKKKYDLLNKEYLLLKRDFEYVSKNNTDLRIENIDLSNEMVILNQEIELYERTTKDLENDVKRIEAKNKKLDKANKAITSLWNDINRKLWCNKETIRQLRKLSKEIMESDKINKNYIASYLHELSLYISAGVEVEAKIKED